MYEVTVVYGAGKGKVMWPGPEIIVMIALSRKKSMQYVLLEAQEAAEQCVIIVLDELSCCWPVSRYRPARTPRRTIASTRCQLSAVVKPHEALDA